MYPPDNQYGAPPPPQRDTFRIVASIAIGLLVLIIVTAVAGGIGFWIGYSVNSGSSEKANTASPTPTPQLAATPVPSPTSSPSPTPTPTPDVGGKYSGTYGDVTISNVTDKTFSFSIDVGTTGAAGSVEGEASRTSPTVAVFSKIPDMELYNDPDNTTYYKKKCRITFRFSGGKVTVSEDEYVCSYWHGAAIDFNGTFTQKKK